MIRIAAVADVHFDCHSRGRLARHVGWLNGQADVLLLAGDLTQIGHADEGKVLAEDLAESPVQVVAVLGNHDYHSDQNQMIREVLQDAGVIVLEKEVARLELNSKTVGIVGLKGFGGGFVGACATDFGEQETKAFVRTTKHQAHFLRHALGTLEADYKIVLMHYSPIRETLHGERLEIYPFLGSYLLGEAADDGGADLIIHGHAHAGVEKGQTAGGIPVRNVAQHVIHHVFNIYTLNKEGVAHFKSVAPNPYLSQERHY